MPVRDLFYDNLKGLLIILVVFCHFVGCAMTKTDLVVRSLVVFIYYFHMPLFIFISGYFSKNADKCREKAFRDLFLVFVVAQIFWVIFKYLTNGSVHYIEHFLDPGYAIWYIVSLFFWRLFLKDIVKIKYIMVLSIVISPLIMFLNDMELTLAINKTVGFLCFFLMGYYASAENVAKLRRIPAAGAIAGLLLIFGATVYILKEGFLTYADAKSILLHTMNMADFANCWQGLGLYYGAIAMAVITGILVIAVIPQGKSFLTHIGEDTLPLYLSHTYFLILCDMLFEAVALSHGAHYAIAMALFAMTVFVFSTKIYRRLFHGVYNFIIGSIYPKFTQKKSIES